MIPNVWCQWALIVICVINFGRGVLHATVGRPEEKPGGARAVIFVIADAVLTFVVLRAAGAFSEVLR